MIGIYKIENNINGKLYIGKSNDIERRWREEVNCKQINNHLLNAFNKYGIDNFTFSVIVECSIEELDILEKKYIAEYKSYNKKFGYNKTMGGEGGCWNEETKRKKSLQMMGEGNHFYGKHHSEETIHKISKGRIGEKHWHYGGKNSKETRHKQSITKIGGLNPMAKKVYQYSKNGELIAIFDSCSTASRETGYGYSGIKNCCSGYSKTSFGFVWSYGKFMSELLPNKRLRPVICVTTGKTYKSMTEAGKDTNTRIQGIYEVCRGNRIRANGLCWAYL